MKLFTLLFFILVYSGMIHAQPVQSIDLSGTWKVTWNEGGHGPQSLDGYLRSNPENDPPRKSSQRWYLQGTAFS